MDSVTVFLIVAALMAGLARGFSGFGAALIFMPLASAVIGPKLAGPLLLVTDLVLTAVMVPSAYGQSNRRDVALMAAGAVAGTPLGTYALLKTDPLTMRWCMVAVVVAMLTLLASGWRYRGQPRPAFTVGVGAFSGFLSGSVQIGGPPVVAYWLGGSTRSSAVRANIVLFFAISGLVVAANYLAGGLLTAKLLPLILAVGPSYGVGLLLGTRLFGLASETTYRRVCYGLIALAAIIGLPLLDPYLRG